MQAEQLFTNSVQRTNASNPSRTAMVMNRLSHLNEQSEIGFDAAAHHVRNRGMKVWLKNQAAQRHEFAEELRKFQATEKYELNALPVQAFFARLHRGWMDSRATMVIGRKDTEKLVLAQVRRAETSVMLRAYDSASLTDIPHGLKLILRKQLAEIEETNDQLSLMLGDGDEQLVVQLFDTKTDMQKAVDDLDKMSTTSHKSVAKPLDDMQMYQPVTNSNRTREIVSSSMLLGSTAGTVIGYFVSAVSAINVASQVPTMAFIVIGAIFGLFCGLLFGLIGGSSNVEEDKHIYADAFENGKHLLFTATRKEQATQVRHVLHQNRWRKAAVESITSG